MAPRPAFFVGISALLALLMLALGAVLFTRGERGAGLIPTDSASRVSVLTYGQYGVLLGNGRDLFHQVSGGSGWKAYGVPRAHLAPNSVATSGRSLFVCDGNSIWLSRNSGAIWRLASDRQARCTQVTSARDGALAVAFASRRTAGRLSGGVTLYSGGSRNGRILVRARRPFPVSALLIVPGRPDAVLAASGMQLIRARVAAGRSEAETVLAGAPVRALALDPSRPSVVYAVRPAGIWRSSDGGQSWRLWMRGQFGAMAAAPGRLGGVYASLNGRLVRITAAGKRLPAGRIGPPAALAVDPRHAGHLYAAYSHPLRLFESGNGGNTWAQLV